MRTTTNRDVAVIVPAHNEQTVLGNVVRDLRTDFPIVVVIDDGSGDDTAEVARESGALVLRHRLNLGQGAALSTGIEFALTMPAVQWLVTFDADGQHRKQDALALMRRAREGDVDVVLGTRFGGEPVEAGMLKRATLKAGTLYTRATTGLALTDTHNGLRALSKGFAESMTLSEHGMGHASEILNQIARTDARWAEVSVRIHYTDYSRAKGQSVVNSVNILVDSLFR